MTTAALEPDMCADLFARLALKGNEGLENSDRFITREGVVHFLSKDEHNEHNRNLLQRLGFVFQEFKENFAHTPEDASRK